jgi:hypothetical protein
MNTVSLKKPVRSACLCVAILTGAIRSDAAGVTIITHGYDGDVNGWITGMADEIPAYHSFPGTNYTTYKITLTTDGSNNYFYQWQRANGSAPSNTDSGEIIVKLDWSQMAGGPSAPYDISTYTVAQIASFVLLQTNAIADLGGHALAEFPLHLIGHSRGGSLVSEMSRILGTNGVWVDHLTTLDPHPFNNDGNSDPFFPTDAPVRAYVNVLFADDYWQNLGGFTDPTGEAVAGAYVRQLFSLSGGYFNTSSISPDHSNVHLWYHGTVDWRTPTSDTEASITASERQTWWSAYEQEGTNAGFEYSLIAGGNRLSTDQPFGPGYPAVRDGYNQNWDLGAGASPNRTALTADNGTWPNVMKVDRTDTNPVVQGQSIALNMYYQWAQPATSNATLSIYLDNDLNPFNSNQTLLKQMTVPGTGASTFIGAGGVTVPLPATNASPGWHSLLAVISGGGQTRYIYAPERVQVISNQQPILEIAQLNPLQFQIVVNGLPSQTIILQTSPDLASWQSIATNTLATGTWVYTNTPGAGTNMLFYRAALGN